jgi:hypothetical protein
MRSDIGELEISVPGGWQVFAECNTVGLDAILTPAPKKKRGYRWLRRNHPHSRWKRGKEK